MANQTSRAEYTALVGSFFLVGLEAIIRILTLALRTLQDLELCPVGLTGMQQVQ